MFCISVGTTYPGRGTHYFPNTFFSYDGEWKAGKMHGQGLLKMGDGSSYQGQFVDGEIEGVGVKRWPDGSTYWGAFHQGHMHGQGTCDVAVIVFATDT
jgi:hypothetical protein